LQKQILSIMSEITIGQITKTLGLTPVETPRPGNLGILVLNDGTERAVKTFVVGQVQSQSERFRDRYSGHDVVLTGYVDPISLKGVYNTRSTTFNPTFHTTHVIGHPARAVCVDGDRSVIEGIDLPHIEGREYDDNDPYRGVKQPV